MNSFSGKKKTEGQVHFYKKLLSEEIKKNLNVEIKREESLLFCRAGLPSSVQDLRMEVGAGGGLGTSETISQLG